MIKTVTYSAIEKGPRLLVLGAIHGNEKCGTVAINRALSEIDSGQLQIARGSVTFIPICNPRAYDKDVRYTQRNLNRYLVPMETPDTYEAQLGNILCNYFTQCDVMLDIHSYTIGGAPFISYEGGTQEERDFAAALGVPTLLTGWDEVYAKMGAGRSVSKDEATGGPQYARRFGAIAVTLECGQHKDPKASEIAYNGIINALNHLGISGDNAVIAPKPIPQHIHMTHVFYRGENGELPKNWKNFETIRQGEIAAIYPDGNTIVAAQDSVIIMPKPGCDVGEEWFYFGAEVQPTAV